MATKLELMADPNSVWNRTKDNEPVFVLAGRDITADGLVDQWANRAEKRGVRKPKCDDARQVAEAMRAYPDRKMPD